MKKNILFLAFIFSAFSSQACNVGFKLYIGGIAKKDHYNIRSYEYFLKPDFIHDDSFNVIIDTGVRLKGKILDCKGAMSIVLIDSIKNIMIEGQFLNGLDTEKNQMLIINPETGEEKIEMLKDFEPIKDGLWKFYKWRENTILVRQQYMEGTL